MLDQISKEVITLITRQNKILNYKTLWILLICIFSVLQKVLKLVTWISKPVLGTKFSKQYIIGNEAPPPQKNNVEDIFVITHQENLNIELSLNGHLSQRRPYDQEVSKLITFHLKIMN
jgi:hypothetical protein